MAVVSTASRGVFVSKLEKIPEIVRFDVSPLKYLHIFVR